MSEGGSKTAYLEGKLAAFHQKGLDENPYRKNGVLWQEWRRGWYAQQIVIPVSGATLIPTEHTLTLARIALGQQAAGLRKRLEPYVRESWEHVNKVGGMWSVRGSQTDKTFDHFRQLFLRVGRAETRLGAGNGPRVLEEVSRELEEIELDLEEACH